MKILCLHGTYGSASGVTGEKNFKIQLAPFIDAVEKPGVEFKWIDGFSNATPPPGFQDYYGAPPLYRFVDMDGVAKLDEMMLKLRNFPQGQSPEDTIRKLVADAESFTAPAVKAAIAKLLDILDENPDIDGVMGYSEGATMAATLVLEERRRWEEEGRPRRLKYAIFFAGWPPVRINGDSVQTLLADECEDVIDVPTCHIVGCNDPYIHGAMALYGICDEGSAILFDHGKGHTVPRDERTIRELANAIETWGLKV